MDILSPDGSRGDIRSPEVTFKGGFGPGPSTNAAAEDDDFSAD